MRLRLEATHEIAPVEEIRTRFPALERRHAGQLVAYFDGPGGTQVPRDVVEAMSDYLYHHNANTHWNYPTSAETDALIAGARNAMAAFFNSRPDEVAFGNNMTTLTFHIARALGRGWGPGDEVVVTELDHHANVAPWRALQKERGVTVRSVPFDPATGLLDWDALSGAINRRTRLVAIGAASNALGTINDVKVASDLAHRRGALCFVDSVHFASHGVTDVAEIGCDFMACSPYKFYGPHAGVLYARADVMTGLDVPKLDPAPNEIPDRLETGTQNHEGIVGTGAAVHFLASLADGATLRERLVHSLAALHARGDQLIGQMWDGLAAISRVRLYGPPPGTSPRTPTLSFVVAGLTSDQVAKQLADRGIFVSNGDFYATTIIERLGHATDGVVRAGCACYTTPEEVDRLIKGVATIAGA
jgi:cysteine desulfurase family protein (TIGR01976 family)